MAATARAAIFHFIAISTASLRIETIGDFAAGEPAPKPH